MGFYKDKNSTRSPTRNIETKFYSFPNNLFDVVKSKVHKYIRLSKGKSNIFNRKLFMIFKFNICLKSLGFIIS